MTSAKKYLIRAFKSIVFVLTLCSAVLLLFYLLSDNRQELTFASLVSKPLYFSAFCILYGLVYPLVSFVKKDAILSNPLVDEKDNILKVFSAAGYELVSENGEIMVFRLKNKTTRIFRLFGEDAIEVQYVADLNSVLLSGMRRDVYRLAKHVEYLSQNNNDLNDN
ncbi:MAG: hypothetical protein LBD59_08145 [Prevotellaceae bacterium]|jgi:hypothetical protein|nr:hypothetical protein [Prevotellaceae bacterium]